MSATTSFSEKTRSAVSVKKHERSALGSICSYSTPSPESTARQDALESVSNDSLVSYSPPRRPSKDSKNNMSPEQVEPYPVGRDRLSSAASSRKEGGEKKEKASKKKSKEKDDKEKKRKRKSSPTQGHEKKKKKHRHHSLENLSEGTSKSSTKEGKKNDSKRAKKHHSKSSKDASPSRSSKVVPKVYQTGSEDPKYAPTFDDISPISSPESYRKGGGRGSGGGGSRYNEYAHQRSPTPISRQYHRSPPPLSSSRSRYPRSPSPLYNRSLGRRPSLVRHRRNSSISPQGRRRNSRSPNQRRVKYSRSPPPRNYSRSPIRRYSSRSPHNRRSRSPYPHRYHSRSPVLSRRQSRSPPDGTTTPDLPGDSLEVRYGDFPGLRSTPKGMAPPGHPVGDFRAHLLSNRNVESIVTRQREDGSTRGKGPCLHLRIDIGETARNVRQFVSTPVRAGESEKRLLDRLLRRRKWRSWLQRRLMSRGRPRRVVERAV